MTFPVYVVPNIIDHNVVNNIQVFFRSVKLERLRKNMYVETYSSETCELNSNALLSILPNNFVSKVEEKIFGDPLVEKVSILRFTYVKVPKFSFSLPWHRDSYLRKDTTFIGPYPYTYKMLLALDQHSQGATQFIDDQFTNLENRFDILKYSFVKKKIISLPLGAGDGLIFRTDLMHRRPPTFGCSRESIIFTLQIR